MKEAVRSLGKSPFLAMFSLGKSEPDDGVDDDGRFRHSPPFSFDSPLFDITTSFESDAADGFGVDDGHSSSGSGGFFPFFSAMGQQNDSMAVDSSMGQPYAMGTFQPGSRFQDRPRFVRLLSLS